MKNIIFNGRKTYNDWGLKLRDVKISFPEIKEKKIEIPGMDGALDLSAILTGDVSYQNRTVQYTFDTSGSPEDWAVHMSKIANELHGKIQEIIHDFDRSFYYKGRVRIDTTKSDAYLSQLVITGEVDPYKYELHDGTDQWLFNPFHFQNGIIRNYAGLKVAGTLPVIIAGRRKRQIPVITCSSPMVLKFGQLEVRLRAGAQKVYELQLGEGEHELLFEGNGTITIAYRGGSL